MWENFAFAIQELRPSLVVVENVRGIISAKTADSEATVGVGPKGGRQVGLTRRALGRVLWDLAALGYDATWIGLRASDVGAPHQRLRVFILGWATAPHPDNAGLEGRAVPTERARELLAGARGVGVGFSGGVIPAAELLPTPAVNDMGDNKTVEWWEEWAPRQKASDGRTAPHGRSLAIELMKAGSSHAFGSYQAAISRWEEVTGRQAPAPTAPGGRDGKQQLNPEFSEWMMGLEKGHITDPRLGLTRSQQVKAAGNGVVPLQAAAALQLLAQEALVSIAVQAAEMTSAASAIRGLVLLELLEPARYQKALSAVQADHPQVWRQLEEHILKSGRDLAIKGLLELMRTEPGRVPRALQAVQNAAEFPQVWSQLEEYGLARNR